MDNWVEQSRTPTHLISEFPSHVDTVQQEVDPLSVVVMETGSSQAHVHVSHARAIYFLNILQTHWVRPRIDMNIFRNNQCLVDCTTMVIHVLQPGVIATKIFLGENIKSTAFYLSCTCKTVFQVQFISYCSAFRLVYFIFACFYFWQPSHAEILEVCNLQRGQLPPQ